MIVGLYDKKIKKKINLCLGVGTAAVLSEVKPEVKPLLG